MCELMFRRAIRRFAVGTSLLLAAVSQSGAQTGEVKIDWEIANRFRLFAQQSDFDAQVRAFRETSGKTVLETEHRQAETSRGMGWAFNVLHRLCFDSSTGKVPARCTRDGAEENYLEPKDLRISLTARLPANFGDAQCSWTIGVGADAKHVPDRPCHESLSDQRVTPNKQTAVAIVVKNQSGTAIQGNIVVEPRDVLIVGLGDSIASGEGNPVRPVALTDFGFCFRRVLKAQKFFLPGRQARGVTPDCPQSQEHPDERDAWDAAAAEWLYRACHRSLYGYQTRAALALAIENPTLSVTYLPLGCSGATIKQGILAGQPARERPNNRAGRLAPRLVESQVAQLSAYLGIDGNNLTPSRRPDLIFLVIGANDVGFAGLVANVIITQNPERGLLIKAKQIVEPGSARAALGPLAGDFRALRNALLKFTGDSLERVVFSAYGNPAMHDGDKACPTSLQGVDAHPSFRVDGNRVAETVKFVEDEFNPRLKSLATCGSGGACTDADRERMTYVDAHLSVFKHHGFCATDNQDPSFDRDCFINGGSFKNTRQDGLTDPLTCTQRPTSFRAFAKRARWIRTVNDSYFAAMTYPAVFGMKAPTDIHDGMWGVSSVLFGGVMHPTAEGHAAMADATLPAARKVLRLGASN